MTDTIYLQYYYIFTSYTIQLFGMYRMNDFVVVLSNLAQMLQKELSPTGL